MKKLFSAAAIILIAAMPARAEQQSAADRVVSSGVLRCGYATSPPVLVKDPNTGKLSGSDIEIVEKIGERLGLKVEWTEEVGWGNFIEGLRSGRYDMMCGSLWPDAARIKFLSITRPVYFDRLLAYVRVDDARFDGDLSKVNSPDTKIAAVDGDASYSMAQNNFPKAKILALPQMAVVADMMMSLITKKADIIFLDPVRTAVFEKENKGKIRPVKNVEPLQVMSTSFGVDANESRLRDMIDVALRGLINDGTVEKLLAKTSPDLMPPKKEY